MDAAIVAFQALGEGRNQLDALARMLVALGIDSHELPRLAPDWHRRTVGRLQAAMRALMPDVVGSSVLEGTEEHIHPPMCAPALPNPATTPLGQVLEAAAAASVAPAVAMQALLRYKNPLEVILSALRAIQQLLRAKRTPKNPTGLFVHAMRKKVEIKVPTTPSTQKADGPRLKLGTLLFCPEADRALPMTSCNALSVWVEDEDGTTYHLVRSGVRVVG